MTFTALDAECLGELGLDNFTVDFEDITFPYLLRKLKYPSARTKRSYDEEPAIQEAVDCDYKQLKNYIPSHILSFYQTQILY